MEYLNYLSLTPLFPLSRNLRGVYPARRGFDRPLPLFAPCHPFAPSPLRPFQDSVSIKFRLTRRADPQTDWKTDLSRNYRLPLV